MENKKFYKIFEMLHKQLAVCEYSYILISTERNNAIY